MKLQFNRDSELWLPEFGVYKPKEIIEVGDELIANKLLKTGYFIEVKEIIIKRKKSKKRKEMF